MDKCSESYLLNKATRLIMRRPHSKQEIFKKLNKVCEDIAAINEIIKELEYLNLLDDNNFANLYAYELFSKKYGTHKVRQKLYQRGIDKELISSSIEEVLKNKDNNIDQKETIKELLAKKPLDLTDYNDRTKAIRFLLNRGFDMNDIKQVMGQINIP